MSNKIICNNCKSTNIIPNKRMKRTGSGLNKGRKMSYGYCYIEYTCNVCKHKWEGERVKL